MARLNVVEIADATVENYSEFALGMSAEVHGLSAIARGACAIVETLGWEGNETLSELHTLLCNLRADISAVATTLSSSERDFVAKAGARG